MATPTYRNALPLGSLLQEYRLDEVLGAGAFGMTYLAWDTHLEKKVAIKEYLPTEFAVRALDGSVVPVTTDRQHDYRWGLERFLLEARTLARFSHPNIVRINRYFETHGTAYVVMDYEDGESLAQVLKKQPQPGDAALLKIVLPLLDGLQAVHEAGFLHRDIKPANVYIRRNGTPVLLDFGAARQAIGGATKSLTAVLTPGYAPIEQYSSDGNQGPWTDIYALGGVLYRALMNENPPEATSRLRNDTVPGKLRAMRGRIGVFLLSAIDWALALDEQQRPQSVREWRDAIERQQLAPATPGLAAGAAQPRPVAAPRPAGAAVPPRPPQPPPRPAVATPPAAAPAQAMSAVGGSMGTPSPVAPRRPAPPPGFPAAQPALATPAAAPVAVARVPRATPARPTLSINLGWVALFALTIGSAAWLVRSRDQAAAAAQIQPTTISFETANGVVTLPGRVISIAPGVTVESSRPQPVRETAAPPATQDARIAPTASGAPVAYDSADPGVGAGVPSAAPSEMHAQPTRPFQPAPAPDLRPHSGDTRAPQFHDADATDRKPRPAYRLFADADTNRDGYVSREESLRFAPLARAFERMDANGDGLLSRLEFDRMRGLPPPPAHRPDSGFPR